MLHKKKLKVLSVAILLGANFSANAANDIPNNWKAECVGRQQLSLPEQADVAGYAFKRLLGYMAEGLVRRNLPRYLS